MNTVQLILRSNDFMSVLNGDRRLWSCGRSELLAVGDLLLTHATTLGVSFSGEQLTAGSEIAGRTGVTSVRVAEHPRCKGDRWFHAWVEGTEADYGAGSSPKAAIGDLAFRHRELLGLSIVRDNQSYDAGRHREPKFD